MAEITYWDLVDGRMPEHEDTLLLYGLPYSVRRHTQGRWYLCQPKADNNKIFELFGINDQEKMEWAGKYCKNGKCILGRFPEFTDIDDFRHFVMSLYEHRLLDTGDSVTISPPIYCSDDYPCSYVENMDSWGGKRGTIESVHPLSRDESDRKCFNGDIHYYIIKEDTEKWQWHSSMFELSTLVKGKKAEHCSLIKTVKSYLSPDKKEEVPSKGITLNKPKKHFKTTIVL